MRSMTVQGQLQVSGTSGSMKNVFLSCSKWGWLVLLVIALMAPFCAQAQLSGKGAVTGTVTDSTGAVIPGASVAATNDATGITTTTTTTGAGDFNFSNLDPGIYTVSVSAKGFEKLIQKGIHVNAMESQTYNPVLTVGGPAIAITVTSALPQLETTNATVGSTMENDVYSELPVEMGAYGQTDQRRATDFAFLMPGVQGNNTNGNPTTNTGVVNGSGARGAASAVYVDGVVFVRAGGNGDPRYVWSAISVDAIDQFQVQTTGYSAVYEGQGVMNYTVKQGGAKQHGSVYEFLRNTSFDTWGFLAHAPNAITGVPVKPVEHSNEYGINLSGPLVPFGKWKEKVFYYGNYNGFRYSSATPTSITFPTPNQQSRQFHPDGHFRSGQARMRTLQSTTRLRRLPAPASTPLRLVAAGIIIPAGISLATGHPLLALDLMALLFWAASAARLSGQCDPDCSVFPRCREYSNLAAIRGADIEHFFGSGRQLHRRQPHGTRQLVHHRPH
jgi:hypothetical protein